MINPLQSFLSLANLTEENFCDKPHKSLQVRVDEIAYSISAIAYKILSYICYFFSENLSKKFEKFAEYCLCNSINRSSTYNLFKEKVINLSTNLALPYDVPLQEEVNKLEKSLPDISPHIDESKLYIPDGGVCVGAVLDFISRFFHTCQTLEPIERIKHLSKKYEFANNTKVLALQMLYDAQSDKDRISFFNSLHHLSKDEKISKFIEFNLTPITSALDLDINHIDSLSSTKIHSDDQFKSSLKKSFKSCDNGLTFISHSCPPPKSGHVYCLYKEDDHWILFDPQRGFLDFGNNPFESHFETVLFHATPKLSHGSEYYLNFFNVSQK